MTGVTRANTAIRRDLDRFTNELRAAVMDGFGDGVWLEKVIVGTRAVIDVERVREEASAVGHLARRLQAMRDGCAMPPRAPRATTWSARRSGGC